MKHHGFELHAVGRSPSLKLPTGLPKKSKDSERGENAGKWRACRGAGGSGRARRPKGSTHVLNEELCQSVLLLDTFFQFGQEKTKRREGVREGSHNLRNCIISR